MELNALLGTFLCFRCYYCIRFSDGAGQPYSLTMLRAFEEAGFNTGKPNKKAMRKLSEYCRVFMFLMF